ncbi:hypothetical protein M9434_003998 [Picochlorum sp. BPE23]|nr:hypothetical protein M9434_003998 [Picochlorum sp. BPE23]
MFVNFFGVVLKPDAPTAVCVQDDTGSDEDEIDYRTSKTVHLTQLALPGSAKQGNHTVLLEDEDGQSYVLGTLNINTCPNVKLDLPLVDQELMLKLEGPSEVHVTGYEMVSFPEDDDEDGYDSEDDYEYAHLLSGSDDDEDDDSDEDEDAPEGIPLGMRQLPSPDDDDEFDGDDINDSDIDMDDDDDDDDDDDSDEEDDESDEEDDESDTDEEEKEAMKKRAGKLLTPQPSKKTKVDNAPATAPSKVSTKKAPTNEQEYTKALKEYLKENGPSKLATLGSSIKRPPAVPKLKRFLSTHASDFVYNQKNDTVSLA